MISQEPRAKSQGPTTDDQGLGPIPPKKNAVRASHPNRIADVNFNCCLPALTEDPSSLCSTLLASASAADRV